MSVVTVAARSRTMRMRQCRSSSIAATCGYRFERLVSRDADAPACPECGSVTRKIPGPPSLGRRVGALTPRSPGTDPATGGVPIPWRGVVSGGPEKVKREVEFRQRLEKAAVSGLRTPGGPDRPAPDAGGSSPVSPAAD